MWEGTESRRGPTFMLDAHNSRRTNAHLDAHVCSFSHHTNLTFSANHNAETILTKTRDRMRPVYVLRFRVTTLLQ